MKLSKADEIAVNVNSGYTRQHPLRREPDVDRRRRRQRAASPCRARSATKHAVVTTNDLSRRSRCERAVEQSEALAKLAPDDPESDAAARRRRQYHAGERATSTRRRTSTPEDRARAALTALEPARKARRSHGGRLHHRRHARRQRARQQQGTVRVQPRDERELHAHRAHRPTAPARAGPARSIPTGRSSTSQA